MSHDHTFYDLASSSPANSNKKRENSADSNRNSKEKKAGTSVCKGSGKKSLAKIPKLTTDNKLEQRDQKWSERFSLLEAMLLSKTFNQPDPVFQSLVGPITKHPPAGAVDNNQPFFKLQTDQPTTTQQKPTNSPATVHQQPDHRPKTDNQPRSTDKLIQPTNPPATHSQQPSNRPKSDNHPTTASTHQPPATHHQPSHWPKTDHRPSASFTHQ